MNIIAAFSKTTGEYLLSAWTPQEMRLRLATYPDPDLASEIILLIIPKERLYADRRNGRIPNVTAYPDAKSVA